MDTSSEKVDKGFELRYWKLSYRRKFIRTIWMAPLVPLAIFLLFHFHKSLFVALTLSLAVILIDAIQLLYTYHKWQRTDASPFAS